MPALFHKELNIESVVLKPAGAAACKKNASRYAKAKAAHCAVCSAKVGQVSGPSDRPTDRQTDTNPLACVHRGNVSCCCCTLNYLSLQAKLSLFLATTLALLAFASASIALALAAAMPMLIMASPFLERKIECNFFLFCFKR